MPTMSWYGLENRCFPRHQVEMTEVSGPGPEVWAAKRSVAAATGEESFTPEAPSFSF